MSDGWVTPKNIVKKRRKTAVSKFHESKSVVDQIKSSASQEKENIQKFNPFSAKSSKNGKESSLFEFQPQKEQSASQEVSKKAPV